MNNEQYAKFVEMLMLATSDDLLKWELNKNDSVFYTTINGCRINLDLYYSSLKDNSAKLELFNSDGASFETILYSELIDHDEYDRLKQLYGIVKDKFYRIAESEQSIIKGLNELLSKKTNSTKS